MHLAGVECLRHLNEQFGHRFRHPHLNERSAELIVGYLGVFQVGLADCFADDRGYFLISEIALPE